MTAPATTQPITPSPWLTRTADRIVALLAAHGPQTRTQLAAHLGCTPQTLSGPVTALVQADRVVQHAGAVVGTGGRSAALLALPSQRVVVDDGLTRRPIRGQCADCTCTPLVRHESPLVEDWRGGLVATCRRREAIGHA
jgi:hypothetical protein